MDKKWQQLLIDINLARCLVNDLGLLQHAAIAIEQGKIAWCGAMNELPATPDQLAHDVHDQYKGQWITPGLIDCHTHLVYSGNRYQEFEQRLQGQTYQEIAAKGGGILGTVNATRAASKEELYAKCQSRLKALMADGITTLEIKSGYGLDYETEKKLLEVAKEIANNHKQLTVQKTYLGAHTIPPEFKDRADDYIQWICNEILPKLHNEGLVDAVDGFCEAMAFYPEQLHQVFSVAQQLGLPVKCHAEQLSQFGGVELAAEFHALSVDHLEYASQHDVATIADAGSIAVLLPGAFYFLQERQHPPIDLLRRYHVPIAIATDCNPGSSPFCSLLTIANMACVQFGLTMAEAWLGMTINGAKALGMGDTHGSLEVGKVADMIIWDDIDHPYDLIYQVGLRPNKQMIKGGDFINEY